MNLRDIFFKKEYVLIVFVFAILLIIIVPLPKTILDFFLVVSLTSAILILLISLFVQKPTDLSTFPTLLLILVLFRLSLNIATTRSILSEGHKGPEAVSSIITAFGEFVVGGNMVLGIIVFIILVLINFIVITKGAGRVSEVQARFSLDALPGKQMSIDADLNSGFIDEKEARRRREQIAKEISFYGTMDGSSKFVKGDAIAGIIITLVNLIGGLAIGVFQHGLSASDSAHVYTLLTIGDGLVAQIPALIISTATAIMITRSNTDKDYFAKGTVKQLVEDSKALIITGIVLVLFSLVPGFPTGILISMGLILFGIGYLIYMLESGQENAFTRFVKGDEALKKEQLDKEAKLKAKQQASRSNKQDSEEMINRALKMEILELKLGAYLLPLLKGGNTESVLLEKIVNIRSKVVKELGFAIPGIRISDETKLLDTNQYSLNLKKVPLVKGEVEPNKLLAVGLRKGTKLIGKRVKEPVFGLDAIWISPDQKNEALGQGCTVVSAPEIIATHLEDTIRKYASDIITRQDIVNIVEKLKEDFPIIVEEAMKILSYGTILKVCQGLLREKIPIIDMLTILERASEVAETTKQPELILSQVRSGLFRLITDKCKAPDGILYIIMLSGETEDLCMRKLQDKHGNSTLNLSLQEIQQLIQNLSQIITESEARGIKASYLNLLVNANLRFRFYEVLEQYNFSIPVISTQEIDPKVKFELVGNLSVYKEK
jgi:flagellar biosynthesis protein FlhA